MEGNFKKTGRGEGLSILRSFPQGKGRHTIPHKSSDLEIHHILTAYGLRAEHGDMQEICQYAPIYMAFVTLVQ